MMPDHADTRAGRSHNRRITFAKGMQKIQRNRARLIFKPIIEERLPAAGLFGRKSQFHPEALEDAGHILKRGGIELIAETGNKELSFYHLISNSNHRSASRESQS